MRKIKLVPDKPFHNYCNISIVDVTDEEKRRGQITIEYARVDIKQLQQQGKDYDAAMDYFMGRINDVIKYYIADDWECTEGCDEVMDIISSHIKPYF